MNLSRQLQVSAELERLALHTEVPSDLHDALKHWSAQAHPTGHSNMKPQQPKNLCALSRLSISFEQSIGVIDHIQLHWRQIAYQGEWE